VVEIRLEAQCFPTEERDKVVNAVLNVFPDAEVSGEKRLTGRASGLERLQELLKRQRIRGAARSVLLRGLTDDAVTFRLNKQVALVGKVSFSTEPQPLGDIGVTILTEDPATVVDLLTSRDEGVQA